MKKILLTILLITVLLPTKTQALTYYTDYSPFIEQDQEILANDLTYVESYQKFKYYYEEKEFSNDYYLEGKEDLLYPFKSNESITTLFNEFSKELPTNELNRVIKEKHTTSYKTLEKIRYLYIYDTNDLQNIGIFISEIEVLNKGLDIDYNILCDKCDEYFAGRVTNKIIGDYPSIIPQNSIIAIDLKDYYHVKDLNMKLYFHNNENEEISYNISLNKTDNIIDKYMNNNFNNVIEMEDMCNYDEVIIDFKKYPVLGDFSEIIYEEEGQIEETSYLEIIDYHNYYSYSDTLFKYYKINKIYLDDYYINNPDYIKDIEKFITVYKYKTRDFIEVYDSLIIDNYNFKLTDIIKDSSIDLNNIKIESNIDLFNNNEYYYKLIYNDLIIEGNITVLNINNEVINEEIKEEIKEEINVDIKDEIKEEINEEVLKTVFTEVKEIISVNKKEPKKKLNSNGNFAYKYAIYLMPSFLLRKKLSKYVIRII